jgi:Tol biopolymer transport system component
MLKTDQLKLFAMTAAAALTLCLLALVAVQPAQAAYPGKNGLIAYGRAFDSWAKNASLGSPEAKLLDNAADLTYSPDGSQVAFMRSNEIHVMNADGTGTPRNLTNSPLLDWGPAWSHDGTRIVFERRISNGEWHIWSMNADGSSKKQLTDKLPTDTPEFDPTSGSSMPSWSVPLPGAPDGKIVFVHQGRLWTMLADGNGKAELSYMCPTENGGVCDRAVGNPTFSPDGSEIAAEYYGDIFMVASGGGISRVLLPGPDNKYPGQELDPAWSPDGTKIAFEHNGNVPGSAYGIYMANADGSSTEAVQLTSKAGEVDPDWQQDSISPQTTITSGPLSITNSTSARFSLASSDVGSTFECSLDGAAYTVCSSPKSYTNLKNGKHTFRVKATDVAGNVDATPAVRTWTVDTIKPAITNVRPVPGSAIRDRTPTISATVRDNFTNLAKGNIKLYANGNLISATKYSYNRSTDRLVYNSPKLSLGKKAVKIVARDAAGNAGVKSWYFRIK